MTHQACRHCGEPHEPGEERCAACGRVLAPSRGAASRALRRPSTGLRKGEVLDGRWVLSDKLGEGGMGSVFLARETALERDVAIKVLSPGLCSSPDFVTRFEREARLMAQLEHPNVVPVYAVGRHGDVPFIVMKRLEGRTLAGFLSKYDGKPPLTATVSILQQVCSALSFIHERGFVHRDIKPSNIFVSPQGHVTLLDLGVAYDPSSNLTRSGMMIGTPRYMSPEQILGTQKIDHRSDLYALGTVLFEMLTGTPPFTGDSDFVVMRAHQEEPPPDPTQLREELPPAIADVTSRALAKRPDDRYQSAEALFLAFQAACAQTAPAPSVDVRWPTPPPTFSGGGETRLSPLTAVPPTTSMSAPTQVSNKAATPKTPSGTKRPATPAPAREPSTWPGVLRRLLTGAAVGALLLAVTAVAWSQRDAIKEAVSEKPVDLPEKAKNSRGALVLAAPVEPPAPRAEPEPAPVDPQAEVVARALEAPMPAAPKPLSRRSDPSKPRPAAENRREPPSGDGELRIVTRRNGEVAWAWVEVDGLRQPRQTPMVVRLSPGRHEIRIVTQDRRFIDRVVHISPGERKPLSIDLDP